VTPAAAAPVHAKNLRDDESHGAAAPNSQLSTLNLEGATEERHATSY
jgi:hypothetical protein